MKKFITILFLAISVSFSADFMAPSFSHPGDLPLDSVPIFICFGFDDNVYLDGLRWADTTFMSRKNPDGSQVLASFYVSTHPTIDNQPLWDYIDTVFTHGHEIGNHTQTHDAETFNAQMNTFELWDKEIGGASADLTRQSHIPAETIIGFRTPFLGYSDATYKAMAEHGIAYDCSIEHFATQYKKADGVSYAVGLVWPYTLDNGPHSSAFKTTAPGPMPGMWELPVYEFQKPTGWVGVTGFDWNLWFKGYTKSEVLELWKSSLKVRVEGDSTRSMDPNRCPFLLGCHSDIYTDDNEVNSQASDNTTNRRAAMTEFIDWALAYNPAVRIVPAEAVIEWMKNPVSYTEFKYDSKTAVVAPHNSKKNMVINTKINYNSLERTVSLKSPLSGGAAVSLYSLTGKMISKQSVNLKSGSNKIQISKSIARGSYIVKVSGVVRTSNFIIVE